MPAAQAEQHVAGIDVLVAGAKLDPKWRDATIEVKVVDSLTLPDMALVRLVDPKGDSVDSHPLQLGKDLEIKVGATGDRATTRIFKGQIAAVEPEFTANGCVISIRAYDKAHKLNRERKTRTFQQVSAADMVKKVANEAGLSPKVTSTNVVHEFFQQSNETDWDFAWRLALMHDYEVVVDDTTLEFRPAGGGDGGAAVALKWQDVADLVPPAHERRAAAEDRQRPRVGPEDQEGRQRDRGERHDELVGPASPARRSPTTSAAARPRSPTASRPTPARPTRSPSPRSTAWPTRSTRPTASPTAHPRSRPAPRSRSPASASSSAARSRSRPRRTATAGTTGYQTSFQISGRSSRTLLELMRPPKERDWSASLVVGVVTNNNDPDQMGRVRVKYPSLSDSEESDWARIATPSAGNARGLLMLPQLDEEVIVGFEHGDTRRPIVVGSVFNGRDKPGADLLQNRDGSFALLSNEKIHQHSKKDFEIKSDQNMTVEIKKDETHKISGNYKNEATGNGNLKAQQYTIEAGSSMTVKGVSVTVEASASLTLKGATVDIQGSGPVNIKGAIINLG